MGAVERADVGIVPYGIYKVCLRAGGVEPRPYGWVQEVQGAGRCGHRPLRMGVRSAFGVGLALCL